MVAVHHLPASVHQPIPEADLDPDAVRIVRRLVRFDHTAYLVGGCVRDLLLGRRPKDFDVATSATPRQVKRLFSNCRIIGRRFRLAHVYFQDGKIIEVATFRARDLQDDAEDDAPADDILIRDDNVFGTPEEDAVRRDFTINALFYDVGAATVLDHADGLGDIRRRVVRTIGDPDVRFREDPIRILRAIKFAARLDFTIEPRTLEALKRLRSEIPKAAPPRVLEEINRFCRGGAARASFDLMFETGVFETVLPELAEGYADNAARETLGALLAAVDARWADGAEIATGEIFAALTLPVLAPALGWTPDGPLAARVTADPRVTVDAVLRPVALRLRVSRRDQERCRQTIATLHRMVPIASMRRGLRLALIRRPVFPDALRLLDALAEAHGGGWNDARSFWRHEVETGGATPTPKTDRSGEAPAEAQDESPRDGGQPGRRTRRRGGRRRGGRQERDGAPAHAPARAPAASDPPARTAARAGKPALPPVWDDDYFFSALPTVPPIHGDEGDGDRYGAREIAPDASPVAPEQERPVGEAPKRRRRRRRRGRGPRSNGGPASESGPPGSPE